MNRLSYLGLSFVVLTGVYACSRGGSSADAPNHQAPGQEAEEAELSLFFAPQASLTGEPDLYSVNLTYPSRAAVVTRQGKLPKLGEWIKLRDLPVAEGVKLRVELFRQDFAAASKTHDCDSKSDLALAVGKPVQAEVLCYALGNTEPVQVFVKTAGLDLKVSEFDTSAILSQIDWNSDRAFSHSDSEKQKIYLRQEARQLEVRIGGAAEFMFTSAGHEASPLTRLINGETLALQPSGGRIFASLETATLKLSSKASAIKVGEAWKVVLPIQLETNNNVVGASGHIFEEELWRDFTVVSYNVENLFDQKDDALNEGYGDYRLIPNGQGMGSNYGQPVVFEGQTTTFTAVKIAHIRQTLRAISPNGPAVIGLSEIENAAVLEELFKGLKDLGYVAHKFAHEEGKTPAAAVGVGIISKFPISSYDFIVPETPTNSTEPLRPILKATLDAQGHPLVVYVNHWKSKGGPESMRIKCAEALEADIQNLLRTQPNADYVILGDLNSDYNENIILAPEHNDTNGRTGINDVLRAQGDELKSAKGDAAAKYNLHYELRREERASAWHQGFGWSSMDHMIVGKGVFESQGISYVDNSFRIPNALLPHFKFLFNSDGTTNRWEGKREGKFTRHGVNGYSDHLPLFARFQIKKLQSEGRIWLFRPGVPD